MINQQHITYNNVSSLKSGVENGKGQKKSASHSHDLSLSKPHNLTKLQQVITAFNNAHYVAYHYPRKHVVSINGHITLKENEAIKYMLRILKTKEVI